MLRVFLVLTAITCASGASTDSIQGLLDHGGLSGLPLLPGSEVIGMGLLRVQVSMDYYDLKSSSDSYLIMPLRGAWGVNEKLEVGAEIPFYLDDPFEDGDLFGDITLGAAWLYETARGGSSLSLRGHLRLPTGMNGRDRGTELELGAATGTTFRLFCLQAGAYYVLSGGRNPFEDKITDYARFSMGGASYVSEDFQIVCCIDGTTAGELGISGSGVAYVLDDLTFFGTLRFGLSGFESSRISAGVSWTGEGF